MSKKTYTTFVVLMGSYYDHGIEQHVPAQITLVTENLHAALDRTLKNTPAEQIVEAWEGGKRLGVFTHAVQDSWNYTADFYKPNPVTNPEKEVLR